jgi:predicted unusual protein kinase regulating ubiquinone biosynthesis (AarF/ABC1/UbiB family)
MAKLSTPAIDSVNKNSISSPGDFQNYDQQAIAKFYSRRPFQVLSRIFSIIYFAVGFVIALAWDRRTKSEDAKLPERAIQLRRIITTLGPTYIKVGQALSTRPDLVRADFLEELTKLQDQLPAFPNPQAFAILEAELDRPLNQIYRQISADPVAAASLGQVYKATLLTGEEVAIKIQRPNLVPLITLDLYVLRIAARWISPFLPLNLGKDLDAIVDEFGIKLFEEIDYVNEAKNAERFAAYFHDDPDVIAPGMFHQFSSRRVLTMEWINGIKLTNIDQIQAAGLNTDKLVRIGVMSGLRQLLEFGFFHADPHPGNLFATYDGKMAYIDFGMMDQLDLETKENLVDSVVHLINRDYEQLGNDYVRLGFLRPNEQMAPIVAALESVLGDIMSEKVGDFNFKVVTDRFSKIMYEYPFSLPAKFALIIRSVVTQEGVALSLNPDFKIVQVAYPYIARRLLTDESQSLRQRLLEVLFKNDKFQWARLENLIAIAKSDGEFDIMPTAKLGMQYLLSTEGDFLRRKLILILTEDNRLHISEVQHLWKLLQVDLQPSVIWNLAVSGIRESLPNIPKAIAAAIPFAAFLPGINS